MSSAALAKRKQVIVRIADLIVDVYVREKLDEDYVIHLAMLYEAGVDIEPIEITRSNHVIEGRHRIAAKTLAGLDNINAIVFDDMPRKDMLAQATLANLGGKRAPTKGDIVLALTAMVKAGASERWIRDQFTVFPKSVMDTYLGEVRGYLQRQKIAQARVALSEGKTIEQAASEVGLTVETLQQRILGKKAPVNPSSCALHADRDIKKRNRNTGQCNRVLYDSAMSAFDDGDLTKEKVFEIFDSIERHGKLSIAAAEDFRRRFNQKIS